MNPSLRPLAFDLAPIRCRIARPSSSPLFNVRERLCTPNETFGARNFHASAFRREPGIPANLRLKEARLGPSFYLKGIITALILTSGYFYVTDTRASVHGWIISPVLRLVFKDAEQGHEVGIKSLKALYNLGLHPRERSKEDGNGSLETEVFGHVLSNPIAISAGLDKNAEAVSALFALGAGIVEVGGITPLPQDGNAKPRVWRIPSQQAIINRYGLNSQGAAHVALELRRRVRAFADAERYGVNKDAEETVLDGHAGVPPGSLIPGKLLAVQIAKNKLTPDNDPEAVKRDYVQCVKQLAEYADIIVVNVSSPNTPGLRDLQKLEPLQNILSGVVQGSKAIPRKSKPAVMVKVSPDEGTDEDIQGICQAVWSSGVDGVIVANTTKSRPVPTNALGKLSADEARALKEQGGYSGPALFPRTLELVEKYRKMLDMPLRTHPDAAPKTIFASGGICTGEDALKVLKAGASVAMVYTALSYHGSGFITELKRQMRKAIKDGSAGP